MGGRVGRRLLLDSSQHPLGDFGIEAKPRVRPATELHSPKLGGVRVDPGALDPKAPGKLGGVHQLAPPEPPLFEQRGNIAIFSTVSASSLIRVDAITLVVDPAPKMAHRIGSEGDPERVSPM
jgi:hypothetical protein